VRHVDRSRHAGAERRGLDHVADVDAQIRSVAEDFFDPVRLIVQAQHDLVDLGHLAQQVDLISQERQVEDGNDRFRCVQRQRAEARPFAPGK
jgi:hypothetical protein